VASPASVEGRRRVAGHMDQTGRMVARSGECCWLGRKRKEESKLGRWAKFKEKRIWAEEMDFKFN
jgi:hypothetical protein